MLLLLEGIVRLLGAMLAGARARLLLVAATILPIARSSRAAPKWDAKAGVWVGERVVSGNMEIPDPLWIFGYGSLCWRPDFPHEETMVGRVSGWGRYFAQLSCDHRGTPQSPGLVATLLSDVQLQALGLRDANEHASVTCGLCYRVGAADAERVLDALDFREKVCRLCIPLYWACDVAAAHAHYAERTSHRPLTHAPSSRAGRLHA